MVVFHGIVPQSVTYHPGLSVTYHAGSYHCFVTFDERQRELARLAGLVCSGFIEGNQTIRSKDPSRTERALHRAGKNG